MPSAKYVSKVNKVAKPPATEVEPPPEAIEAEPDTYGGAKYVSRINRIQQGIQDRSGEPESAIHRYSKDLMYDRGLSQRLNQNPRRFVEDGTHGMWTGNMAEALSAYDWGSLGMWAAGAAAGASFQTLRKDKQLKKVTAERDAEIDANIRTGLAAQQERDPE